MSERFDEKLAKELEDAIRPIINKPEYSDYVEGLGVAFSYNRMLDTSRLVNGLAILTEAAKTNQDAIGRVMLSAHNFVGSLIARREEVMKGSMDTLLRMMQAKQQPPEDGGTGATATPEKV